MDTMITLEVIIGKASIGSRELKTHLGAYLRHVQKGRAVIVTERGRPVAELRPLGSDIRGEDGKLDELVDLGVLTRQTKGPLPAFKPIRVKGGPLSETIIEDREGRF